jgi:hypothetical protein
MSYNPEDHQVTCASMAGPLVLWACALLALFAMGPEGAPAVREPVLLAAPCGPQDPGMLVQSPGRVAAGEVHAS